MWSGTRAYGHCRRVGISSWEGLWCRFEGDDADTRWLRDWSPSYRREAWQQALADQGVEDGALAEELGERFGVERRARHEVFADALPALRRLSASHPLALVTNGASCLQREKLAASDLGDCFATVVVSAEYGAGKPDARIFRHALAQLGADTAVMIGDSLARDVDGALAAGLGAVWLDRAAQGPPDDRPDLTTISSLSELPALLD